MEARYEHTHHGGSVVDSVVLTAIGVDYAGKRDVLGLSVCRSEAEVHWRDFLQSLVQRGLQGGELVCADDHPGLRAARKAVLPGLPWQRCQLHLQRNVQAHTPKKSLIPEVHDDLHAVFNAKNRQEADRLLSLTVKKYQRQARELTAWMAEALSDYVDLYQRMRRQDLVNLLILVNKIPRLLGYDFFYHLVKREFGLAPMWLLVNVWRA